MSSEDAIVDSIWISVAVEPIHYKLLDGRGGETDLVFLEATPEESSWSEVRIGDWIEFTARLQDENSWRPAIFWKWPDQMVGEVAVNTQDARCLSILEKAPHRSPNSPLVPFTGMKGPRIVGDPRFEIEVGRGDNLVEGMVNYWMKTLDAVAASEAPGERIIEFQLRPEYGDGMSFRRIIDGRKILLECLARIYARSIVAEFVNVDYDLGVFHLECVWKFADALRHPSVVARLEELRRSFDLRILAATTDDVDDREFAEIWPRCDELQAYLPRPKS